VDEEEESFAHRSKKGNNDYEFLKDSSEKKVTRDQERQHTESHDKYKKVRM